MNYQQNQTVNLEAMSKEQLVKLRNDCDKELDKRFKSEQRKAKAKMIREAKKYGLIVKVETKKTSRG